MKKIAVIVAGGSGQRMGSKVPKQFLLLRGKPLLHYTIQAFLHAYNDMHIILVLPTMQLSEGEQIVKQISGSDRITITPGGSTRFESVRNGLQLISEPSIVFVHDGVRCLVSEQLIRKCYEQALEKGSAIPAITATDSIRIAEGSSHYAIDRSKVVTVQTPQTFHSTMLQDAFKQDYHLSFTDEATVVETAGNQVFLVEGEYTNLKVTRPVDLMIAEKLLDERLGASTQE